MLFLTARDATEDKVHGLTLGGDDYIEKPFSLDELVARVEHGAPPHPQRGRPVSTTYECADLHVDIDAHRVRGVASRSA